MAAITTWEIQKSIPLEMDIIFTMINDYLPRASLSATMSEFLDSIPADMVSEIRSLLGEGKHFYSLFVQAAYAAGTAFEGDYVRATMPIRQMDLHEAVDLFSQHAIQDGITLEDPSNLPLLEQFKRINVEMIVQSGQRLGFKGNQSEFRIHNLEADMELLSHFLKDGDLHARFWHWMDRFYYQVFHPWRLNHLAVMAALEERARLALGAPGSPLQVDWLPQSNPLRSTRELIDTMQQKGLHVIFITEPFQLPDFWFILPQGPATSFAEGGDLYRHFFAFMEDLSVRLKALADPTRLAIMRIVRSSPQDNTVIATHLGISRPTVSIHAKQLREAGLIRTFEEGRSVRHEVVYQEIRRLFQDLERFLDLPPEEDDPSSTEK